MVQACLLLAAKVWSFVAYLFKKQYRTVSLSCHLLLDLAAMYSTVFTVELFLLCSQIQQYKAIKYDISPLSPISRHRLNMVRKKVRKINTLKEDENRINISRSWCLTWMRL